MDIKKYIITDPAVCFGKPCFKGTRIMVYLILEMLASGESAQDIIKHAYPKLSIHHIKAALQYASSMAQQGHIIPLTSKAYAASS